MKNFKRDFIKQFEIAETKPSRGKEARQKRKLEFQKFLKESGLQADLAKCLRMLYEEPVKPRYPVKYIRSHIGVPRMSASEYKSMQVRLQVHLYRINELERQIQWAKEEETDSYPSSEMTF